METLYNLISANLPLNTFLGNYSALPHNSPCPPLIYKRGNEADTVAALFSVTS